MSAERLEAAFRQNFAEGLETGASMAIWRGGEEVLALHEGWRDANRTIPWTAETIVLFWSATKGLANACVLHALERASIDLNEPVTRVWPEFAGGGKGEVTLAEVLSHRAGLSALEDTTVSFLDHEGVIAAIERQAPLWPRGEGHGYGPRVFGYLADEIVRRLSGRTLGAYWREEFGDPLGLDLWIGLPESEHHRAAQMLPPRAAQAEDDFSRAMAQPDSLTRRAFSTPSGPLAPSSMNTAAMRSASLPSLGGIGSASSLAKFYSLLAGDGTWGGRVYFAPETLRLMSTPLSMGRDLTLCTDTSFAAGFMVDPVRDGAKTRSLFGPSLLAFGHPGAGGSLAFGDPESGTGFAYVMNQMEAGVLPRGRALRLVQAFYNFR